MQVTLVLNDKEIVIDNVVQAAITVNRGLTVGVGSMGQSFVITPQDLPALMSRFTWPELISKIFSEK